VSEFVLNDFIPYQLAALSEKASREFSRFYRERFGLSVTEWRVIANLSQARGPVSVREINRQVAMEKSKVSRAATRLEKRGLVIKQQSRCDGRLVELSLSEKGRDIMQELTPIARDFEDSLLAPLGDDRDMFKAALGVLLAR